MKCKSATFTEILIAENDLDPHDFKSWVFYPGMCFNSTDKWWGDCGRRDFPHEGLDFCLYQNAAGEQTRLEPGTRIPVMHAGMVKALFSDYLGQAVILEHETFHSGAAGKLLSVYAHTDPQEGILPGVKVKAGDIIAAIADTRRSKAKILPHLHLSFGYPSPELVYEPFVWNSMRDSRLVELLDPRTFIDWPCRVMETQNAS